MGGRAVVYGQLIAVRLVSDTLPLSRIHLSWGISEIFLLSPYGGEGQGEGEVIFSEQEVL
jgi:hypothetical protein